MKAKIPGILAVTLGLLAGPLAAHATVTYEFSSTFGTYTYTSPTFVTADVVQCDPFGLALCGPTFNLYPDSTPFLAPEAYDIVAFAIKLQNSGALIPFVFADGVLGQTGTFSTVLDRAATLTIRQVSSVPEPGTLALLGLGLVGLGVGRRKRAA